MSSVIKYYLHKHYARATTCGIDIRTLVKCLFNYAQWYRRYRVESYLLLVNSDLEMVWKGAGKGKGKVICLHAVKSHRGDGGVRPFILEIGTRWR